MLLRRCARAAGRGGKNNAMPMRSHRTLLLEKRLSFHSRQFHSFLFRDWFCPFQILTLTIFTIFTIFIRPCRGLGRLGRLSITSSDYQRTPSITAAFFILTPTHLPTQTQSTDDPLERKPLLDVLYSHRLHSMPTAISSQQTISLLSYALEPPLHSWSPAYTDP